jgi:hypothetical protein
MPHRLGWSIMASAEKAAPQRRPPFTNRAPGLLTKILRFARRALEKEGDR